MEKTIEIKKTEPKKNSKNHQKKKTETEMVNYSIQNFRCPHSSESRLVRKIICNN